MVSVDVKHHVYLLTYRVCCRQRLVAVLLTNNGLDDVESPHSSISNPKDSEDGSIVDFVHLDTGRYRPTHPTRQHTEEM